jgi:hypothetical protein
MSIATARPLLHIGRVVQNAAAFNFSRLNGGAVDPDSLVSTVDKLFELLHERGIEYVLVGGIAMLQYVEGRNTEDIDLIMALSSLKKLPELKVSEEDAYFARGTFRELQIDLLLTRNRLFDLVRRKYVSKQRFVEREIACATVEGLLVLKLYALASLYRQGNFARVGLYENDIATLLHEYKPNVELLFATLNKHLSETDLASVRGIVTEIQERVERFNEGL